MDGAVRYFVLARHCTEKGPMDFVAATCGYVRVLQTTSQGNNVKIKNKTLRKTRTSGELVSSLE